jgi:coatomer protein complex subunit gamma
MTHPTAVQSCNLDMENLITDQNRSVATFAITTLLKAILFLYKKIFTFFFFFFDKFKIQLFNSYYFFIIKLFRQAMKLVLTV